MKHTCQFTGKSLEHWNAGGIAALFHDLSQPDLAKSAEFNRWVVEPLQNAACRQMER